VMDVPTLIIARTDADAANLLTSDIDERDRAFIYGHRTHEGFYKVKNGLDQAISRGLAYAPYADLVWCETSNPDIEQAKEFARAIRSAYPNKLLAYNCSPSFNWAKKLSKAEMLNFREQLADLGYKFQFITLAGFHSLNTSMFELASAYYKEGMLGYSSLQEKEFSLQQIGFKAVRHQAFVGTGYFDAVQETVTAGLASTAALKGSTEEDQFHESVMSIDQLKSA
jgi:isocitrate lyase